MTDDVRGAGRAFVVGCPRSGTTLLQSMLGQHPAVLTLPETHYAQKVRGRLDGGPLRALVSPRAARRALRSVQEAVGVDPAVVRPPDSLRARAWERALVRTLDEAASQRGAAVWVEKSPVHLRWVEELAEVAEGCGFVHVLRDGRDVVASFYRLCLADPERWVPQLLGRGTAGLVEDDRGRRRVLDAAVDRWNQDVARSARYVGHPRHHVVVYEELVDDPARVLGDLCAWLGLGYDDAMLRPWEAAPRVVGHRGSSPHMRRTFGPVVARRTATFHEVLGTAERARVVARLTAGGAPPVAPPGPSVGTGPPATRSEPPRR